MHRTRIKICGLTRPGDVDAAVDAGADAVGLVFYPPSPRSLTVSAARALRARVPPFVSSVALFVNPTPEEVENVLNVVRPDLLQFHGSEDDSFCASFGRPYMKALSVGPGFDLVNSRLRFRGASALLLDTPSAGYGGSGKTFDWSLIPATSADAERSERAVPLVLSGGLSAANVGAAIGQLRPHAVDVSSGVEEAKGLKDPRRIREFIAAVQAADAQLNSKD